MKPSNNVSARLLLNSLMTNIQYPHYVNEVFDVATDCSVQLRGSFQVLKCSFCKTKECQLTLPYICQSFWNKTQEALKCANILNIFKHNSKKYFLKEIENSNSRSTLHLFSKKHPYIFPNILILKTRFIFVEWAQCKYKHSQACILFFNVFIGIH